MLVALNMHLIIFELLAFTFKLAQLALIFLPYQALLLRKRRLELGCVLDRRPTLKHLRLQRPNLGLKPLLCLLLLLKFLRAQL